MTQRKRRSERRVMPRAEARLSMRVEGQLAERPDPGATQIVTESQNISASGVYCLSPYFLAPLSKVALTIVLPGRPQRNGAKRLVKCEGVVVRCLPPERSSREKQYQLACSFIGLEDEYKKALDDFVAWRNLQAVRGGTPTRSVVNGRSRTPARSTTRRSTARRTATRGGKSSGSGSRSGARAVSPRARAASRPKGATRGGRRA